MPEFPWTDAGPVWICRVLKEAGLVKSTGEARRLIAQGAVRIDGNRIENADFELPDAGAPLIQVGKRRIMRVRFG